MKWASETMRRKSFVPSYLEANLCEAIPLLKVCFEITCSSRNVKIQIFLKSRFPSIQTPKAHLSSHNAVISPLLQRSISNNNPLLVDELCIASSRVLSIIFAISSFSTTPEDGFPNAPEASPWCILQHTSGRKTCSPIVISSAELSTTVATESAASTGPTAAGATSGTECSGAECAKVTNGSASSSAVIDTGGKSRSHDQ